MDYDDPPPGKRKKVIPKCPNPLFTYWLIQLKDDASSKGLKTAYSYGKALKSLHRYPLPLPDGKSCKILESFGDKTCKYLDDKLRDHIDLYGSADFVPDEYAVEIPGYLPKPKAPRKKPSAAAGQATAAAGRAAGGACAGGGYDDPGTPRQRKKSGGVREYLPLPGSGPYAMLITLLTHAGANGHMTKATLMREAQHLSDTSFTIPDPGIRYTAWSSMGTLIRKALVIKRSSPAKYNLTPAGVALAQRLLELDATGRGRDADGGGGSSQDDDLRFMVGGGHVAGVRAPPRPAPLPTLPNFYDDSDDSDILLENTPPLRNNIHTFGSFEDNVEIMSPAKAYTPKRTPSKSSKFPGMGNVLGSSSKTPQPVWRQPERSPSPPLYVLDDVKVPFPNAEPLVVEDVFQFTYCTEEGALVRKKDQAAVTISEEIDGIGFLITADYTELLISGKLYTLDHTKSSGAGKVFAFVADKDAPETCPTPLPPPTAPLRTHPAAAATAPVTAPKPKQAATKPRKPKVETVTTSTISDPVSKPWRQEPVPKLKLAEPAASTSHARKSPWDTASSATSSRASSGAGSRESSQDTGYDVASVDEEPAFTLNPGTFDVILCVDKREHFGGAKSSKQLLMPELQKHQTKFELKNLTIGDFAWVARPKNAPEGDREVVLDYIVERKRMDDLSASICDRRFTEQKITPIDDDAALNSDLSPKENQDPNISSHQQNKTFTFKKTTKNQVLKPAHSENQKANQSDKSIHMESQGMTIQTKISDWGKHDSRIIDRDNIKRNASFQSNPGNSKGYPTRYQAGHTRTTLDNFILKPAAESLCSEKPDTTGHYPPKTQGNHQTGSNSISTKSVVKETSKQTEQNTSTIDKTLHQLHISGGGLEKTDVGPSVFVPLVAPPVERLPPGPYEQVFFDLEATGLGVNSHIVQLAAAGPFGSFNRYVKPKVSMSRDAAAVTGIRFMKGRLFHNGRPVFAMPIKKCLEQFLRSLPRERVMLVGHNAHQYDARVMLTTARACGMEEAFVRKVSGFLDTLPLFRTERPNAAENNSQVALVRHYLGEDYNAHNAKADSSALRKLLRHCEFTKEQLMAHTITTGHVLRMLDFEEKRKSNRESLWKLVDNAVLSEGMTDRAASQGVRYEHLVQAHKQGGAQAVHKLMSELNTEGKARVTKSLKILNKVSDYLKEDVTSD